MCTVWLTYSTVTNHESWKSATCETNVTLRSTLPCRNTGGRRFSSCRRPAPPEPSGAASTRERWSVTYKELKSVIDIWHSDSGYKWGKLQITHGQNNKNIETCYRFMAFTTKVAWILTAAREHRITHFHFSQYKNISVTFWYQLRVIVLAVRLHFREDGEDEGSGLIGLEGGRYNHVFTGFQHQELHHLAGIQVGFSLGDSWATAEERRWELPHMSLELQRLKWMLFPRRLWEWKQLHNEEMICWQFLTCSVTLRRSGQRRFMSGDRKNVKSYLLIIKTVSAHFLNQPELQPACTSDLHIRLLCLLLIYCHHPFS